MNEIVYEVTGRFVVAGNVDAETVYARLADLATAGGEHSVSIRERPVQAPPSTEIVTHTPAESQAVLTAWDREDVQAVRWLLEAGLPVGFVGPVATFDEAALIWCARFYWRVGTRYVVAMANHLGEFSITEVHHETLAHNETREWLYSRECWRAAIIAAVGRMTVCGRIDREAAEIDEMVEYELDHNDE